MKMPERLAEYLFELADDLSISDPSVGITPDNDAADEIRHIALMYQQGGRVPLWIPVEERLPNNEDIDCLVSCDDPEGLTRAPVNFDGRDWEDEWGNLLQVTHWMPVPPLSGEGS